MFMLDAILWLTPHGEIAIPMGTTSHGEEALSIADADFLASSAFQTIGCDRGWRTAIGTKIGAGIGLYAGAGKYYSAQAATLAYVTRDLDNLGTPSDRFTVNADFKSGLFTLSYRLRWFARQYVGDYGFYNSLNGNAPTDPYYAN